MNKKPIELHVIEGTKPEGKVPVMLPEQIKKRVPHAEWLDNPKNWDRAKFIKDTSDFLYEVYGIGSDQDRHTLAMLADNIEVYIEAMKQVRESGIVSTFNNGGTMGMSPYLTVKNKATTLILQLMNELGLTPRGRLSKQKAGDESPVARILRGPKG